MNKKIYIFVLVFFLAPILSAYAQKGFFQKLGLASSNRQKEDVILKRNGKELKVNVTLVTELHTYYKTLDEKDTLESQINNSEIFMIKYSERGNMFFYETGDVVFDDSEYDVPDDAIILYLIKGKEVPAYELSMDSKDVRFYTSRKKVDMIKIPRDEIFLVKYTNGISEVITEFEDINVTTPSKPQRNKLQTDEVEIKPSITQREAVIKTNKNVTINAIVVSDNDEYVSYYRKDITSGVLYSMDKGKIKSVTYSKVSKRRSKK